MTTPRTNPDLHVSRVLTDSELATILHGLRTIQENANGIGDCMAGCCDHFDDCDELNDEQIDELCMSINCDSVAIVEKGGR